MNEKQMIEDLIRDENEAINKYSEYAKTMLPHNKNISNLFTSIKNEEVKHLKKLENLAEKANILIGTIGRIIK